MTSGRQDPPVFGAPPSVEGDRRPRVALDVTPALRQSAGVGRYTRELAQALQERGQVNLIPFVADRPAPGDDCYPGVRHAGLPARWLAVLWHRLPGPVRRVSRSVLAADRLTGPADLWHATDFLAPPVQTGPVVVTVHDLTFLRVPEYADPGLARYLGGAIRTSVRQTRHVIADSDQSATDAVELLGLAPTQVTRVYPGIGERFLSRSTDGDAGHRTEAAPPSRNADASEPPRGSTPAPAPDRPARVSADRPYVLGVGTLEPRKDWPTLIRAFEAANFPDHALIIAGGEGWATGPIHAAAQESRADVRLLGFVADEDLPGLYAGAAAFAYPSRYEGFGLPPLEAMAVGTPTIVSDAPCMPEVVGDGALVFPAGDVAALAQGLTRLIEDQGLRRHLAAQGRARAKRFTWDRAAAEVEAVYASCLAGT